MEYIYGTKDFACDSAVVTIGKFDGVHRGHRMLLNDICRERRPGQKAVVFTFDINPASFLAGKPYGVIYSAQEKCFLMERLGLDMLINYPFDLETSRMQADEFITDILAGQLGAKVIAVGRDCRFGYRRHGDVSLLQRFSKKCGYKLHIFDKKANDGGIISSTRIREAIVKGDMETAAQMLGEPFMIYGKVMHGQKLGRKLGMPTINQIPARGKVLPPNGVYFSRVEIEGMKKVYTGITNIGIKPTVGSAGILAETHIMDFSGDLYGKDCRILLYHFQRGEKKFSSIDELSEQMHKDMDMGREFFERR